MSLLYSFISRQYLISQIPIYITMLTIYFFITDLLTPNLKGYKNYNKIYNWLSIEIFEHIAIPIILVLLIFTIGVFALVPVIITLIYLYGKVLGNAETWHDWKKVLIMTLLFFTVFMIPELIWILKFGYNVYYLYPLSTILFTSTLIYLQFKFNLLRRII